MSGEEFVEWLDRNWSRCDAKPHRRFTLTPDGKIIVENGRIIPEELR
jgi:hypothetical protein